MRSRRSGWLAQLVATLLLAGAIIAPAQHSRMVRNAVLAQTGHVVALYGSAYYPHSGGHSHHVVELSCFACLIVAAPGLLARPSGQTQQLGRSSLLPRPLRMGTPIRGRVWPPQRARAPPLPF